MLWFARDSASRARLTRLNRLHERFPNRAVGYSPPGAVGFVMKHGLAFALAAALCACAPAPVEMSAARAAEVLNLFAAGRGPASICSDDGRAVLRGAVRSYAREMSQSGVSWPSPPGDAENTGGLSHVDVSVMIAYAAGFVRPSDFEGSTARVLRQQAFGELPAILSLRRAARVACEDVQSLQQAAARFVLEEARMAEMARASRVRSQGMESANRLRRQSERVGRAREALDQSAAIVRSRMGENQVLPLD